LRLSSIHDQMDLSTVVETHSANSKITVTKSYKYVLWRCLSCGVRVGLAILPYIASLPPPLFVVSLYVMVHRYSLRYTYRARTAGFKAPANSLHEVKRIAKPVSRPLLHRMILIACENKPSL
jgi:hypothetical protein